MLFFVDASAPLRSAVSTSLPGLEESTQWNPSDWPTPAYFSLINCPWLDASVHDASMDPAPEV